MAEYLTDGISVSENGNDEVSRLYESTRSNNYDLYLPFIERGISLLKRSGHLGYIAPSVWLLNDYGVGLKSLLIQDRCLERWIDFKDFPVFDEAMTYTALQFYRGHACERITFSTCSDGQLATVEDEGMIDYDSLESDETWVFLPDNERQLISDLNARCTSLNDHPYVATIFQGIITSADYVFHLERIGQNRYRHSPQKGDPYDVEIEDALMRPLISGTEAKRYQKPQTEKYLLFPYESSGEGQTRLIDATAMATRFPKAWAYLGSYEQKLRSRERSAFDDDQWYRFGRNQNIDKQDADKLGEASH